MATLAPITINSTSYTLLSVAADILVSTSGTSDVEIVFAASLPVGDAQGHILTRLHSGVQKLSGVPGGNIYAKVSNPSRGDQVMIVSE